jgi:alpha-1,2-mannosyltransferase
VFYDQRRVGNPANPSDQSLSGAVARLAGTGDPPRVWWLVAVLVAGLAGLTVAVWAHYRGYRLTGFLCCAITGLLVSPFSWTHHWVWVVPLLTWLAVTAWRRRAAAWRVTAAWWATAAGAAALFSGFVSLPPPGHPPGAGTMAASDLYVLAGLALLAATGVGMARRREPARAGCGRGPAPGTGKLLPGGYFRARTRGISLSMSEDSAGCGERTLSSWLLTK